MKNQEEYKCHECFYCRMLLDDEFICTKINKIIQESPMSAECCDLFNDYWDIFNFVEESYV